MRASPLHERFPGLRDSLPHVALSDGPTPVRRLAGVLPAGAGLWVKDDGAFGTGGWGGNKVRKLEWLLPDARRRRARTIVTFGGLGTNWGLAAALYGREHGLRVVLALVDQPVDEHVRAQQARLRASGARLYFTHGRTRTIAAIPWLLVRHAGGGRPPYLLPPGGSSAVGALGYVDAALELAGQVRAGELPEPSHVVVAVGSGGTAAGLVLGLRLAGLSTRVTGVVVNDGLPLDAEHIVRLARRTERVLRDRGARLPVVELEPADVTMVRDWIGPGYGHHTAEGDAAIARLAPAGLRLDPVYTGKAMAGLLAMAADGRLAPGPVLFVHTDGPRG